jgi:ankyrin repeat protein
VAFRTRELSRGRSSVNARDDLGNTWLHTAAAFGNINIVKLLLKHGGDVRSQNVNGCTPLHVAVSHARVAIIKTLLNWGSDIHARDNYFKTVLNKARLSGNDELVQLLISYGSVEDPTVLGWRENLSIYGKTQSGTERE